MDNPCKNCICNIDEYCRCEKLTVYETYQKGAREFAEWLCKGVIPQDNPHVTYSVREMLNDGSSYEVEADVLITEWQKGAEGGRING